MRVATAILLLLAGSAFAGGERVMLGEFSTGDTGGWRAAAFDGIPESDYSVVEIDGRTALRGRCRESASVFGLRRRIDLGKTPILNWSWRVETSYEEIDERSKAGDDFPARVYAVIEGGWLKWRTRALNYIWAGRAQRGDSWPNPYRKRSMMVVLRSGDAQAGEWVSERRNLRTDFRRYFDIETGHIDGIALMTDCDDHGGRATAYYGDIYLTERTRTAR